MRSCTATPAASLLCAALAVSAPCGPALDQDVSLDGIVRSASIMAALQRYCAPVTPFDAARARAYRGAFEEIAGKLGGPAGLGALGPERTRRFREVEAEGARTWCLRNRGGLLRLGLDDLFR